MKYIIKVLFIVLFVGIVIRVTASPLEISSAPEKFKVTKIEYEADIDSMVIWIEGMSDRTRPTIPVSDYTTEAEFETLVKQKVLEHYTPNLPTTEPTLPTDKINEAIKLVGKEIAL